MRNLFLRLCFWMMIAWLAFIPSGFAAEDLCPQDSAAVKNVPGDAGGVQADIDRLNLCVERAKLLKQLDDIAKQRSDMLNKIKDPAGSAMTGGNFSGMPNGLAGGINGLAPLPMNAFPALPAVKTTDLKPGEIRVNKPKTSPFGDSDKEADSAPPLKKQAWKIRKIWGQAGGVSGAVMRAQIVDSNGTLLNVAKGDPLPDGKTVQDVSVKGVTLSGPAAKGDSSGKNNTTDLSWDDSAAPDSSPDKPDKADEGSK